MPNNASEARSYSEEEFLARSKAPPPPTAQEREMIRRELLAQPYRPELPFIVADWLMVSSEDVLEEARALGLEPPAEAAAGTDTATP